MNTRASVTLYIIIGLALVIVGGLAIAYREEIRQSFIEVLNPEVKDVRLLVENCLESTTKDVLRLAAVQGGYLELPSRLEDSFAFLPPPPAAAHTPYWWFRGTSYIPTKEGMEKEFAAYVNDNLGQCLDNFASIQRLSVSETGDASTTLSLDEGAVNVAHTFPIRISFPDGKEVSLNTFKVEVPSQFFTLYGAAKSIMEQENEKGFLEDLTMDMIATADGAGDSPHFPFEGFDVRCGRGEQWSEQLDLIPQLQEMVQANFHFLSFSGMQKDYDPRLEDNREIQLDVCAEEKDGICTRSSKRTARLFDYYDSFYTIGLNTKGDFSDIKVKTQYTSSFPMSLDVEPSRGDTVRGFNLDIPIVGSCIKVYHHRYTIEYPLLFQLNSAKDDLTFAFATPVVIEKNKAKRTVSPYTLGEYSYSPDADKYCQNAVFQRDIFVKDVVTGEEIDGAKVNYQCVKFNCELGETKYPTLDGVPIGGSIPVLRTGFPECVNGFLTVEKDGYVSSTTQYTVNEQAFTLPPITLTPLRALNIEVGVVETQGNSIVIRGLGEGESVYLAAYAKDKKYEDSYLYPANEYSKGLPFELILGDQSYEFDAKLIKDNKPV